MEPMAGNALPLVLLAGAAFLLTRKKGDEGKSSDLPSDQGSSAKPDEGTGIPAQSDPGAAGDNPNIEFDPSAHMPWVETIEDYQQWGSAKDAKAPLWIGSMEFLDMNEELADVGKFVEAHMPAFGNVYGRTVDRSELDPVASEAMASDEMGVDQTITAMFAENPGLEMILIFIKPSEPQKMALFLLFADAFKAQESVTRIGQFKQAAAAQGIETTVQSAYFGMNAPSVEESVKAFLHSTLPKSTGLIQGALIPIEPVETQLNP
jgi:hypothetical protein